MSQETLDLLKQLPTKEYVRLWSSPTRYVIKNTDDVIDKSEGERHNASASPMTPETASTLNVGGGVRRQSASPASEISCSSDISSSASTKINPDAAVLPHPLPSKAAAAAAEQPRSKVWSLNTKSLKDVLVRTYPSFAQIILSPVTSGLRHTINVNVIEELIDLLGQCANDEECKAVLVSGIGGTFTNGVDLSVLAYDAVEKRRRSAEALAVAIRRLVKVMMDYPKVLMAGVNGFANGLGVSILPLFDVVFASDKATFATDYAKLGQVPEAFANHTFFRNSRLASSKMLMFGKTVTAEEAASFGLVSDVVWPDKFLEEIVPRIEQLEDVPGHGLSIVKAGLMGAKVKAALTPALIDEETRELVRQWTAPKFAKNLRRYLKENHYTFH